MDKTTYNEHWSAPKDCPLGAEDLSALHLQDMKQLFIIYRDECCIEVVTYAKHTVNLLVLSTTTRQIPVLTIF